MGAIISMIMMLGMFGAGIYLLIHRCDILQMCDQSAAAAPAADTSTTTAAPTDTPSASDNNKKKKCGCCSCVQRATNLITCTLPSGNSLDFTSGHSLSNQCSLCASDPNICANNPKLNNKVPKQSSHDANMSKANALAKSSPNATSDQKAAILGGSTTRPKGCDLPLCNLDSSGTPICTCPKSKSHYARSNYAYVPRRTYYADAMPRNPFRSQFSYI